MVRIGVIGVGVIGVGVIGQDHIRRLQQVITGSTVVAVADSDPNRSATVAAQFVVPNVLATGEEIKPPRCRRRGGGVVGRRMSSMCWPASLLGSRCSARSRWPPPARPASTPSTPRWRRAAVSCRSASCAATTQPIGR